MDIQKNKILFLCTGNSCRSQMAEGFAHKYLTNVGIKSAGTKPEPVNLMAIEVMHEMGVDMSKHHSKSLSDEDLKSHDIIITLCGDAKDECANLSVLAKKHVHWKLKDPAKVTGSHSKKINIYRKIRDQIEKKIKSLNNEFQKSFQNQ